MLKTIGRHKQRKPERSPSSMGIDAQPRLREVTLLQALCVDDDIVGADIGPPPIHRAVACDLEQSQVFRWPVGDAPLDIDVMISAHAVG